MAKYDIEELNRLYNEGKSADNAHFSEMRTNYLLYNGEHWKKTTKDFLDRSGNKLNDQTKLRISENHIGVNCNRTINAVLATTPMVMAKAVNENELSDQKDAEICNSVLVDGWKRTNFEEKLERLVTDCVVGGEFCNFLYLHPNKGKLKGYEQETDELGNLLFENEVGEVTTEAHSIMGVPHKPKASDRPVFEGEIVIESVYGYNVTRQSGAQTIDDSEFIFIDKMTPKRQALGLLDKNDPDYEKKKGYIEDSSKDTYSTFNGSRGSYEDSKDQTLLRYFFARPCCDYAEGWFSIHTSSGIAHEGPLPYGIWPVVMEGHLLSSTSPRYKSKIRDARMPQYELNRVLSQSAVNQLAAGDAKVFTQMGSKVSKGETFAGVRTFTVNGPPPAVVSGTGAEWFETSINRFTDRIYKVFDHEFSEQVTQQSQDLLVTLYSDMKKKAKYSDVVRKVQRGLVKIWTIYLQLAKHYYDEDRVVLIAGKRERINIAEFKDMSDVGYQISVEAVSEDIHTIFGKLQWTQMVLQYAGKQINPRMIGRLVRMMPYGNEDQMFNEYTAQDEMVDADILALDRGQWRNPRKSDDHDYFIHRLEHRRTLADFEYLPPQVQQMYEQNIQIRTQIKAQQIAEQKQLQAQFIPTDGPLATIVGIKDEKGNPIKLPYNSIMTLVKMLETQGSSQEHLQFQDQQMKSEISKQALNLIGSGQPVGMQQTIPMPQQVA